MKKLALLVMVAACVNRAQAPAVPRDSPLIKAIAAADACQDACPAIDALYEAAKGITPETFRAVIPLAKGPAARGALTDGVAPRLDEGLVVELVAAANACGEDESCQALLDLSTACASLRPAVFRAGLKAATTRWSREMLIVAIRSNMDPSVAPDIEPFLHDPKLTIPAQDALGQLEDDGVLAELVAMLDEKEPVFRMMIPTQLAHHPMSKAVRAAIPRLHAMADDDPEPSARYNALRCLLMLEGEAAVPRIVKFLGWPGSRKVTATVLIDQLAAYKKNPIAAAALKKLAADSDETWRKAAKEALERG
jgi:hypothetical protein